MRRIILTVLIVVFICLLTGCLVDFEQIYTDSEIETAQPDENSESEEQSDEQSDDNSESEEQSDEQSDENSESEEDSQSDDQPDEIEYSLEVLGGNREFYETQQFDAGEITVILKGGESDEILLESEYELDSSAYNGEVVGDYVIIVTLKSDSEVKYEYTVTVKRDEENGKVWGKDLWL